MTRQYFLTVPARARGFHLITSEVLEAAESLPQTGLLHVFIRHTSAALAINENADPSVRRDLEDFFDRIAPENGPYRHTEEGPDDMPAHLKGVLIGSSITIPISKWKLGLGTWQGIYLCEFRDQATPRNLVLTVLGE